MTRMNKFILIALILLILVIAIEMNVLGKEVDGLITAVDLDKRAVRVEGQWYCLAENASIMRNGLKSSLNAIGPITPGFYQLGLINLDDNHQITSAKVFYSVLEGEVEEVSASEGWFNLKLYRQDPGDQSYEKKIYWEKSYLLKQGDHLIITAAGNRLLKLIQDR